MLPATMGGVLVELSKVEQRYDRVLAVHQRCLTISGRPSPVG